MLKMDKKDLLKSNKKCDKTVRKSKYEKPNPKLEEWWYNEFKIMEQKAGIPDYKKLRYLKTCFSKHALKDLLKAGIQVYRLFEKADSTATISEQKSQRTTSRSEQSSKINTLLKKELKYTNPYLKFIHRKAGKVQFWRKETEDTDNLILGVEDQTMEMDVTEKLKKMDILEKAKFIEEKIAKDYCDKFHVDAMQNRSEVDPKTILDVFEVMFSGPMPFSLSRTICELGAVPDVTAKFLNALESTEETRLSQMINEDINTAIDQEFSVAFGKCLPMELRRRKPTQDQVEKWFHAEMARHQDLLTMAAVWNGITGLHSTRAFCLWLLDHPDIRPPKFLQNEGLMIKNVFSLPIPKDMEIEENEKFLDEEVLNVVRVNNIVN